MLMKKSGATKPDVVQTPPFVMPTLEDSSETYAALIAKKIEITDLRSALSAEERKLRKEIEADTTKYLRTAIANLLGDDEDTKPHQMKRISEISRQIQDIDIALDVLRERISVERGKTSLKITAACRPEYARRVAVLGQALRAVQAARAGYDEMVDEFSRNEISWTSLVPLQPNFLGDARDGHVHRWFRAAKDAGYDA
ncbi:hypothetical protein OOJ09_18965 [Mesorhizobium qingshengii]|uniref:Uncharacterized protein n=1 Tax=Mesorhizobium qingshengii TaxID=1165689 RepID=A0ABT4QXK5_9HYPH|nr:hypothetical protein [Mesorhizobium qingshengii]MCZ8546275.1 hypothetical protein [Mesorhizobium qingshengii]